MAAIHITDIEAAINHWRNRAPASPDGLGLAPEVQALGARAVYVAGSAGKAEVAHALVERAEALGNFAGYIHNAGVLHPGPLLFELAEELFLEVLEANLLAGYQLARFAYPVLRRKGEGLAVYVGSGAAESNLPGIGAYAVAKAAEEAVRFAWRAGRGR